MRDWWERGVLASSCLLGLLDEDLLGLKERRRCEGGTRCSSSAADLADVVHLARGRLGMLGVPEPCFLLSELDNHVRDASGNGWRYLEYRGGACVNVGEAAVVGDLRDGPTAQPVSVGVGPALGSRQAVGRGLEEKGI